MRMHPDNPALPGSSAEQVLVLGIGNVLLRDDGVGVRVLQALEAGLEGDDRLRFVDGGTIGFMLQALIEEAPDLLVIDAVRMSASPGSVRCFENEDMDRFLTGRRGSVHEIGLSDVLDMARLTGRFPRRRALVGVEPSTTELGEQLSAEVEQGLASAVLMARGVLHRWLDARGPVA
jgi:hydrogenase maturation protease